MLEGGDHFASSVLIRAELGLGRRFGSFSAGFSHHLDAHSAILLCGLNFNVSLSGSRKDSDGDACGRGQSLGTNEQKRMYFDRVLSAICSRICKGVGIARSD